MTRGSCLRPIGEILDDIGIVEKLYATGAIMTVVGAHRREAVGSAIRQVLVLDACADVSVSVCPVYTCIMPDLHPSMPPLPVARYRPCHSSGSQSSKLMLDRFDVGICKATRHTPASRSCSVRPHEGTLSLRARVVPPVMCSSRLNVELWMCLSGRKLRHRWRKLLSSVDVCLNRVHATTQRGTQIDTLESSFISLT